MPPWLIIWIARWASGERFRKATSEDYRLHFGAFFLAGVLALLAMTLGERILDHASALIIWIFATACIVLCVFGAIAWARLVPATVSLLLAIITWGGLVWFMLWKTQVL